MACTYMEVDFLSLANDEYLQDFVAIGRHQQRYRSLREVARAHGLGQSDDAHNLPARTVPAKRRCSSVYAVPPPPLWEVFKLRSAGRHARGTPWAPVILENAYDADCDCGSQSMGLEELGEGGAAEQYTQAGGAIMEFAGDADAAAWIQDAPAAAQLQDRQQGLGHEQSAAAALPMDLSCPETLLEQHVLPASPNAVPAVEIRSLLTVSETDMEQQHSTSPSLDNVAMPKSGPQHATPEAQPLSQSTSSNELQQHGIANPAGNCVRTDNSNGPGAMLSPRDPRRASLYMPAAVKCDVARKEQELEEEVGVLRRVIEQLAKDLGKSRSELRDVKMELAQQKEMCSNGSCFRIA